MERKCWTCRAQSTKVVLKSCFDCKWTTCTVAEQCLNILFCIKYKIKYTSLKAWQVETSERTKFNKNTDITVINDRLPQRLGILGIGSTVLGNFQSLKCMHNECLAFHLACIPSMCPVFLEWTLDLWQPWSG